MANILHMCAKNDHNGNPQRLYVLSSDEGEFIAAWDEGYMGFDAVPGIWRKDAYLSQRFDISITKYKQLKRTLPSPDYAHEVKGYAHLVNA